MLAFESYAALPLLAFAFGFQFWQSGAPGKLDFSLVGGGTRFWQFWQFPCVLCGKKLLLQADC
jgi:hypothetical protein